ncbi:hypothetical protein GCM10009749_17060 [Agromyces neolithicus]|uniref:Uncharacterized protein n=1 Tax=Agromyces neolithicus TaxID=269420 RepID=A0ABN2M4E7_9MICO
MCVGCLPAVVSALISIFEGPERNGDARILLPMGLLGKVPRVRLRVDFGRGQASVDKHLAKNCRRHPGTLLHVAPGDRLVREVERMHQMLVSGLIRLEQPGTRQMYVLVIDDDGSIEVGHRRFRVRKSPTSPGGRWGVM